MCLHTPTCSPDARPAPNLGIARCKWVPILRLCFSLFEPRDVVHRKENTICEGAYRRSLRTKKSYPEGSFLQRITN